MAEDALAAQFGMDASEGTVLFRQGDVGGSLYVVRSGQVRLTRSFGEGTRILATVGAGEFFGEMSVVSGRARSATAEVVESASLLKIRAEKLEEMLVSQPEIAVRLIRRLADRVDASNRMIEALLHDDPSEKVIVALNNEAELSNAGVFNGDTRMLAGQLGLSVVETDLAIKRLVRVGILEKENGGLKISDTERLKEFLDFVRAQGEAEAL